MLNDDLKELLLQSIKGYAFPCRVRDFDRGMEIDLKTREEIGKYIHAQLVSPKISEVKDGLSNVLFWGYAHTGYGDSRIQLFRESVSTEQLMAAKNMFAETLRPNLYALKHLRLPQLSGVSFISKIRMFLDLEKSAALDRKIIKMKFTRYGNRTILGNIVYKRGEGQIRATVGNSAAYELWCQKLVKISARYFDSRYSAAEIERGFFKMVRDREQEMAAKILASA